MFPVSCGCDFSRRSDDAEATYPNGRRELLSYVDNFQWNWHINYVYDEAVAPILPAGTVIAITAWHDNSEANRNDPDARQ